ncbi:MAG TPA: pyruvate kinase [Stellaceae bacterium]|nr:pyruvate kinase [Stellaceae bacterium]
MGNAFLPRARRTKILATLGPASSTPEMIQKLFEAGADNFRLNFSHGTHQDHAERVRMIRDLEARVGQPIGILADVQGPKLRVGAFEGGKVMLTTGQKLRLDMDEALGTAVRARLPHPEIIGAATIGSSLLLDDGKLRLKVVDRGVDYLDTEVMVGGMLSDRKGVNVPDVVLPIPALTTKDRTDMEFAIEHGIDFIGLSFTQRADDVAEAREIAKGRVWIMTKFEKPQALENLESILALSDCVMVARGDLGVEMPPEEVPIAQKRIVRAARQLGKPVVVATQMLESMINAPAPTRAEASDVATAVFDGADAVMLSAETAAGQYPIEAATIMSRIVERVEKDKGWRAIMNASREPGEKRAADAISSAAQHVADMVDAKAIVAFTLAGTTALRVARERPDTPIIGLTPNRSSARRMAIAWGVHPVVGKDANSMTDAVEKALRVAYAEGFADHGETVVVTAGVPFGQSGTTNALRIATVSGAPNT